MRNTITLNGVESSTIPGLLIQELAPISKPLMRTEVETIDGRDGDITTNLGFSAYDKQITIGLFGEFDINQVIAYFNSKGTVIFSNEPDKFYNYEIVEQIDFERLVRYRTATVTMHCQPFKYSTTEGADILSTNDNFATLNQSLNTDTGFYTYSSNVQDDITAIRSGGSGGKFFAVFSVPVVQGVTYYFSGNGSKNISMYGYTNQLRGTSAGISGKGFTGYFTYTATFTGTMVLGFYSNISTEIFIRNFKISNQNTATVSGEGTNIVLENSAEAPFSRFDLKGNTEQTTYSGKNLIGARNLAQTSYSGLSVKIEDGVFTLDGTPTQTVWFGIIDHNLGTETSNITLEIIGESGSFESGVFGVSSVDSQNTQVQWHQVGGSSSANKSNTKEYTSTVKSQIANMRFYVNANSVFDNYKFRVQMTNGSTPDFDYEPYVGGTASPNPDYPQAVRVVTGEQTIIVCGKNLIPNTGTITNNGITCVNEDSILKITGTATSEWCRLSYDKKIPIIPSGTPITLSITESLPSGSRLCARLYKEGMSAYENAYFSVDGTTLTKNYDIVGIQLYLLTSSGTTIYQSIGAQIEKGTATAFEPHREQSYPISLGSTELCKIGDSQDYIYKNNDNWYVHKAIGKLNLWSDSTNWYRLNTSGSHGNRWGVRVSKTDIPSSSSSSEVLPLYSSHFAIVSRINTYNGYSGIAAGAPNSTAENFAFYDMRLSQMDLDGMKEWLAEEDPTLYYQSTSPSEVQITSDLLIQQLEALSQANAYRGRTHINASAATGNVPHIIAAEVATDPSGTITNSGNIYSKPKLTIFGSGSVGVYLNGVQMFQIALGTNDHITIDTALMEAYQDNLQTLKNRSVTGDYNNFKLPVGESEISFSGNVTMCVVENYSRWL